MIHLDSEQIGVNIRKARRHKSKLIGYDFTRKMLAYAMGEPVHLVTLLEVGEYFPDFIHAEKIAETCGVELKDILGYDFRDMEEYLAAIRNSVNLYTPVERKKGRSKPNLCQQTGDG